MSHSDWSDAFDHLLAGKAQPAGREAEDVKKFVQDVRSEYSAEAVDEPVEAAHLTAMMEAAHLLADKGESVVRPMSKADGPVPQASGLPKRRRIRVGRNDVKRRLLRSPVGKLAAAMVALFTIFSGVALAGVLPAPVQRAVADAAGTVGIHLPSPGDDQAQVGDDQGEDDQSGVPDQDAQGDDQGDQSQSVADQGDQGDQGENSDSQGDENDQGDAQQADDQQSDDQGDQSQSADDQGDQGENSDSQGDENDQGDQGEQSGDQGEQGDGGGHQSHESDDQGDQGENSDHQGDENDQGDHDRSGGGGGDQGDQGDGQGDQGDGGD